MGLGRKVWGNETLSAPEVQGYLQDQAVMFFPSANARDGSIPAPSDGMVCYLGDVDRFEGRINGAWAPLAGDRTVGEGFYAGAPVAIGSGTGWSDLATVSGVATGRPAAARWSAVLSNGNSGADRTGAIRVVLDDVTILGTLSGISVPLANLPRIPRAGTWKNTPTAGAHTWKLQAQGSAAASVIAETGALTVVEV